MGTGDVDRSALFIKTSVFQRSRRLSRIPLLGIAYRELDQSQRRRRENNKEIGLISPKGNERGAHFLADCFFIIARSHTD